MEPSGSQRAGIRALACVLGAIERDGSVNLLAVKLQGTKGPNVVIRMRAQRAVRREQRACECTKLHTCLSLCLRVFSQSPPRLATQKGRSLQNSKQRKGPLV